VDHSHSMLSAGVSDYYPVFVKDRQHMGPKGRKVKDGRASVITGTLASGGLICGQCFSGRTL
jgi:hypothetical protein